MLPDSPNELMDEVRAAEAFRDDHLETSKLLEEEFSGREHNKGHAKRAAIENASYEWVSLIGPRLVFDNPKVVIRSSRPGAVIPEGPMAGIPVGQFAAALTMDQNQWIRETNLRDQLVLSMLDDAFAWGPLLTVAQPHPAMDPTEPISIRKPRIYRLSPRQWGIDPQAPDYGRARFAFHHQVRDRDDLLREAREFPNLGWRASEIAKIGSLDELNVITGSLNPATAFFGRDHLRRTVRGRQSVIYYEVWVPERQHPEADAAGGAEAGFHGTIYTLARTQGKAAVEIRDPRPYWGPSWGPYTNGGFYPVPDDPYRLSPLVATRQQARELDAVSRAISWNVRKFKRLIMVDSTNPKLSEDIQSKPDLMVVPVAGFGQGAAAQLEFGGITNQHAGQLQFMRDRLDRATGIDEARRGNPQGVSATEADIAARAGETRLAFMQRQFRDKVRQALKTAAWYIAHDFIPPGLFDTLDLEIEPLTMERLSEPLMQQRAVQMTQMAIQLAQAALQLPHLNVPQLAATIGQAFNEPDFGSLVDHQLALQLIGLQMATGAVPGGSAPAPPSQSRPAPRPSRAGTGQQAGINAAESRGLQGRPAGSPTRR